MCNCNIREASQVQLIPISSIQSIQRVQKVLIPKKKSISM
uniref:Uncharacterized protein n=1 Tax=Arundo donax TaxID=35708 RepID=A0A0A9DIR0_ARUDO